MKHSELNTGILRAYLDGQSDLGTVEQRTIKQHIEACAACQSELIMLGERAASVRAGIDQLPQWSGACDTGNTATAWAQFQKIREQSTEGEQAKWNLWQTWALAGGLYRYCARCAVDLCACARMGAKSAHCLPRRTLYCA